MRTKVVKTNTVLQYWKRYEFTAGTYEITIPEETTVNIILVGGGGGGAHVHFTYWESYHGGGPGAVCYGQTTIPAGTYQIVVGGGGAGVDGTPDSGVGWQAGGGGNTTAFGQVAGGGGGAHANANYGDYGWDGGVGSYSVDADGIYGIYNGYSRYSGYGPNNYGAGGGAAWSGVGGYARIDVLSNESDYTFIRKIPVLKASKDENDKYYAFRQ